MRRPYLSIYTRISIVYALDDTFLFFSQIGDFFIWPWICGSMIYNAHCYASRSVTSDITNEPEWVKVC